MSKEKRDIKVITALKLLMTVVLIIGIIFFVAVYMSELEFEYKAIGYIASTLLIIPSALAVLAKYQ